MEEVINGILIREVETKNIMTKSSLPVGGYSVNPYVGCTHACKYCYASFMKRFTGHTEPPRRGVFLFTFSLSEPLTIPYKSRLGGCCCVHAVTLSCSAFQLIFWAKISWILAENRQGVD